MKDLYLKILNRFKEVPQVKYVDEDYGQIDDFNERPPVAFPCALISLNEPKRSNLTPTKQLVTAEVIIRLGFEFLGDTSSISSENRLNAALLPYDIKEAVEAKFQAWGDADMNRWECTSCIKEKRNDGLVVFRLSFKTGYQKNIS